MKWLRPRDERKPEPDSHGIDEAASALDDALSMWPEVQAYAEQIRGIRRRNHLSDLAENALKRSPR